MEIIQFDTENHCKQRWGDTAEASLVFFGEVPWLQVGEKRIFALEWTRIRNGALITMPLNCLCWQNIFWRPLSIRNPSNDLRASASKLDRTVSRAHVLWSSADNAGAYLHIRRWNASQWWNPEESELGITGASQNQFKLVQPFFPRRLLIRYIDI